MDKNRQDVWGSGMFRDRGTEEGRQVSRTREMGMKNFRVPHGRMLAMPGLVLWSVTPILPFCLPGTVLTHGGLHAPAHALHLPCA